MSLWILHEKGYKFCDKQCELTRLQELFIIESLSYQRECEDREFKRMQKNQGRKSTSKTYENPEFEKTMINKGAKKFGEK